ncbi:MAG: hypothetical protein AAGJ85_04370 [Pseudomonadota bacterium]
MNLIFKFPTQNVRSDFAGLTANRIDQPPPAPSAQSGGISAQAARTIAQEEIAADNLRDDAAYSGFNIDLGTFN